MAHMLNPPNQRTGGTETEIPFTMGCRRSGFTKAGCEIVRRFPKPHEMNVIE